MRYQFDWDPAKERRNIHRHGVSFRQATSVFRDPNQVSAYDEGHSDVEERWVTLGLDSSGTLRVVVHTFVELEEDAWRIRIISARKATTVETRQYRERNP
ncbi:MAG: BrnT family toxin [Armatimonadetes bacterium]|nr:BrnT family toxin [Armatimonadota bacterium]